MSRSKPRITNTNPARKFISLSGTTGKFNYWNKEKKESVDLEYPIVFLPLDVLSTIKGFSQKSKSGIYSNEIHNISKEILTVKIFDKGEIAKGLYSDIKDSIKNQGAKYCRSVYAMMYFDNVEEIVNFQFVGASLGSWIEYENKHSIYDGAVKISGVEPAKTGATEYFIPKFTSNPVSKESEAKAEDLDKNLQKYLEEYKSNQTAEEKPIEKIDDEEIDEALVYEDEIPW